MTQPKNPLAQAYRELNARLIAEQQAHYATLDRLSTARAILASVRLFPEVSPKRVKEIETFLARGLFGDKTP